METEREDVTAPVFDLIRRLLESFSRLFAYPGLQQDVHPLDQRVETRIGA